MGDSGTSAPELFISPRSQPGRRAAARVTARALALGLDRSRSVADGARELRATAAGSAALRLALRRIEPAAPDELSPQGRAVAMLRSALAA